MVKSITSVTVVFLANNTAIGSDVYIILITPIAVVPKKYRPFERLFCKILSWKNQNYNLRYRALPITSVTKYRKNVQNK